jgi:hypothetical protein
MRFLFGRGWVFEEEADDGTQGGAGGGGDDTVVDDNDAAGGDDTAAGGGDGKKVEKVEQPKDMLAAIDAGLGYKKDGEGFRLDAAGKRTHNPDGTPITPEEGGEKKGAKPPAAAGAGKETDTHYANGKPKKNEKGEPLDDKGQVVKASPKLKTAAELDLKPEERKALGTKAQIRFGELINTVKAHEARVAQDAQTIKGLTEARDTILGVMQETGTSQDMLAAFFDFQALSQSKDPKDLEAALGMVEEQRAALYKALGREPKGGDLDLLAEFPDLKKQVDEEEITRAAALEIAHGRRDKAARAEQERRREQQQQRQTQTAEQQKKAGETALAEIEKWTAGLAKTDLDYKAKEDKLLAKLEGVLKEYTPDKWLSTLKLLYDGIEITKAPATPGGHKPLRPTHAKPGAKAPTSMLDAINQGLGYAGAEKG